MRTWASDSGLSVRHGSSASIEAVRMGPDGSGESPHRLSLPVVRVHSADPVLGAVVGGAICDSPSESVSNSPCSSPRRRGPPSTTVEDVAESMPELVPALPMPGVPDSGPRCAPESGAKPATLSQEKSAAEAPADNDAGGGTVATSSEHPLATNAAANTSWIFNRRSQNPRRSEVAMEVLEKDLGVAFGTRARSAAIPPGRLRAAVEGSMASVHAAFASGSRRDPQQRWASPDGLDALELVRIFPEMDASASKGGGGTTQDGIQEERRQARWQRFRRDIRVPFSNHTAFATVSKKMLKASALISCAFVLASLALEPICVPSTAGSSLERLSAADAHRRVQALALLGHAVNSSFYVVLSMASRVLFGKVDVKRGEEVVAMAQVLYSHLRTVGFWLDLVSIVGYLAELAHLTQAPPEARVPSAAHWVMLLQLGKAWRILMPEVQTSVVRQTFLQGVVWLLFSMALVAHFAACVLLTLGVQEASRNGASWTQIMFSNGDGDEVPEECVAIYTESFYFAALSLTSVGYGDILVTPLERGINAAFLLLFQLFCTKVCADLTWLTSTHNHWEAEHQALRAQTWASLQNMQVPHQLAQRVMAFQSYVARVHREDLSQPMFTGLSANLISELRLCAYRKLVLQAVFLREQPKEVIGLIVGSVVDQVYLPADFVLRCGAVGRELYFVRRGSAAVFVGNEAPTWGDSQEVATYVVGNYFGELAMLTGRPRAAWVMATTYCVCTMLPYSAVEKLAQQHPGSFTKLVQSMIRAYHLKASMRWQDVLTRMLDKYCFNGPEEAFTWLCAQGGDLEEENLTAKAFEEGMRRLKVPQLDRKIFWAQLDVDSSGEVSYEEFLENVPDEPRYRSGMGTRNSMDMSNSFVRKRSESFMSMGPNLVAAMLCGGRQGMPEDVMIPSGSNSPTRHRTHNATTMDSLEAAMQSFGRSSGGVDGPLGAAVAAARMRVESANSLSEQPTLTQLLDELSDGAARVQRAVQAIREHQVQTSSKEPTSAPQATQAK